MRTDSGSMPRFSGPAMVCTALTDHADNGLVHLLVAHTTDPKVTGVRYVEEAGPVPPSAALLRSAR